MTCEVLIIHVYFHWIIFLIGILRNLISTPLTKCIYNKQTTIWLSWNSFQLIWFLVEYNWSNLLFRNTVTTARKRKGKKKDNHQINYATVNSIAESRHSCRIYLVFFEIFLELWPFLSFPPYFKWESIISRALFHFSQHTSAPGCYQVNWPRISQLRIFYGGCQRRAGPGKYNSQTPGREGVSDLSAWLAITFRG